MKKLTTEEYIEKAKDVHGDKYDYSQTIYVNNHTKLCIICPIHGEFYQNPQSHLSGCGCPHCYGNKKSSTEVFIKYCTKIHNGKYNYDKTQYVNKRTKVIITCPIHGDFEQEAGKHKLGQGCPLCGKKYTIEHSKNNFENFINESNKRFNEEYSFPFIESEYENSHSKVTIVHKPCNTQFTKIACDHITSPYGGCTHCYINKSYDETELYEYIKSLLKIDETIVRNVRNVIDNNEIDIYLPNRRIAIEYNGLYWHSELYRDKKYHANKTDKCNESGIRLIQIFEDEWIYKKDIVKSMLKNLLQVNDNKIYARKCVIKEVSYEECSNFLNNNHLQGMCVSKYRYGLYYNDVLVSLMTFGKLRKNVNGNGNKNDYELLRFCNKLNTTVVGGASKLLKHFIKTIHPQTILSYADRRYSNGNLYTTLGFHLDHISDPNYSYIIKNKRYNRFGFRKDVLINKYNCPSDMSEHEFMKKMKWYRIYDCGNFCYKMWFL